MNENFLPSLYVATFNNYHYTVCPVFRDDRFAFLRNIFKNCKLCKCGTDTIMPVCGLHLMNGIGLGLRSYPLGHYLWTVHVSLFFWGTFLDSF